MAGSPIDRHDGVAFKFCALPGPEGPSYPLFQLFDVSAQWWTQITILGAFWILLALVENSRRHNGAMGSDFPVSSDIPIVCGRDLTQSLVSASSLEGASHRRPFLSGVVTAHETGCASESVSVDFD